MPRLSKEIWATIEPLLDQALDLAPAERESFLAHLDATSPSISAEVRALLAAEGGSPELVDEPPASELHGRGLAGQSVGTYTLDQPIGQGGMATVWLAHRTDGRFQGQVAVKLLNLALVGRAGEERFAREGTLLARLTHPHIARLLDAGVTAGGQPFLVLEHVVGQRIDRFADARRRGPVQRIALCLDVLDALAAAHNRLIIHRDIKPSNILVTDDGEVKLLDFGIAKLMLEGLPGDPATLTEHSGRALTPEYAAPELIRGEPVAAATDVYSAGVLLYLLLSGRHPTGEGCRTAADHLRAVLDVEPARLSDAVTTGARQEIEERAAARGATPERLRRLYAGDLDNILAKALKKRPAERYQTVAAFADDLVRFQDNRPVSARPDSRAYRAGKFVRRHRTAVSAAALIALTLMGATGFSLRQLAVARRERDHANEALRRSQASTQFESLLFRLIEPDDPPITYHQLLEKGRQALERAYQGDPVSGMEAGIQFAENYSRAGDHDTAYALTLRTVRTADSLGQPAWRALTRCELAFVQANRDRGDSALALIREARGYLSQVPDPERGTLDTCDRGEGQALMALGQPDSAARPYAAAVDRFVRTGDSTSSDYLDALGDYALSRFRAGRLRPARDLALRLLAGSWTGAQADPQGLPIAIHNVAVSYEGLGELRDEQEFFRHAIAMAARLDTATSPFSMVEFDYGMLLAQLDRGDSAITWLLRALARPGSLGDYRVYSAHLAMARSARLAGRPSEAEAHRRAALSLAARVRTSPSAQALSAAYRIEAATQAGTSRADLPALVRVTLDSLHYSREATARTLVAPLAAAAAAMIEAGAYPDAADYADHLVRLGSLDSLTAERSATVGRGLLLGAQAALGLGDRSRARDLARRATAPLAYGLGPGHPLSLTATALRDSLSR